MTPEQIKAGVQFHERRIAEIRAEAEGEIGIHRAHIEKFRRFCKHPNRFETCCMGDSGWRCPDCEAGA